MAELIEWVSSVQKPADRSEKSLAELAENRLVIQDKEIQVGTHGEPTCQLIRPSSASLPPEPDIDARTAPVGITPPPVIGPAIIRPVAITLVAVRPIIAPGAPVPTPADFLHDVVMLAIGQQITRGKAMRGLLGLSCAAILAAAIFAVPKPAPHGHGLGRWLKLPEAI